MPMSGEEMVKLYIKHGWHKVRQRGSHIILKKGDLIPETIPMHKELKKGLERKLLKRLEKEK